jgi:transcriptional regulator with XRE-family HTH domain
MKNLSQSIGDTIKLCRDRRKMNQRDLASRAGLSVSYLSLIEQGKRTPNLEVLEDIAAGLDLPLNLLIFLASDKTELAGVDETIVEKLSLLAWKALERDDREAALQP